MLLPNKIILFFAVVSLTACGFKPVYKSLDSSSSDVLASVQVESNNSLMGQFFKTKLVDLLNPMSKVQDKQYKITSKLTKNKIPFAIQQDRTITRYKITVLVEYKLTNITSGKIVDEGILKREGGYDKVESDYASYISDEDTTKRIVKELAEDTNIRIMSTLID